MEWNNMETFWWRPHLPSRRQEGTSFLRVTECRNPWSWMAARSSRLQSPPAAETCTDQALPQSFREGVTTKDNRIGHEILTLTFSFNYV